MKNNFKILISTLIYIIFFSFYANSNEPFNFDITEVEIKEDGNKFIGTRRGTVTTDDGVVIVADQFNYDKILNILNASGNVKIDDNIKSFIIYSDNITYLKNQEKIFTQGNSKAINDGMIIDANKFRYDKNLNILNAQENVKIDDKDEDFILFTNDITYLRNQEKIFTKGKTEAIVENKYNFFSEDVLFDRNKMELSSSYKSTLSDDKSNFYELDIFKYFINEELLKAKNLKITSNINLPKEQRDKFLFSDAFINLENENFEASKTELNMKKDLFGIKRNDPRVFGASSSKMNEITQINKGVFTSCKKNDKCPPWSIKAKKIKHDKNKKQLIYNNAILQIYDKPILYFPKFFHPDPSVKRQSGFLKPELNNSKILGSSLTLPYFHVLSDSQDITITPNIFDSNIYMLQSEFRQETEYSSLVADYAFTKGYQSSNQADNGRNSISHLFTKFNLDLNLENFKKSDLDLKIEKVTNDTYLKVFDTNLTNTLFKPNKDTLTSALNVNLNHEEYEFSAELTAYEKLTGKSSDRYQFILPHYNFSKNLLSRTDIGSLDFSSSGSNNLQNTNHLMSKVSNNLNFNSFNAYSKFGFENNFNIYLKNINTVAKNDKNYKSSPQSDLMSIFETQSSLPFLKLGEIYDEYITPKISFRVNPSSIKDFSGTGSSINVDNIFGINRLGLADSFESGKSLTLGLDYKKENIEDINKYFELKFGTVFRDTIEENLPQNSSINQKSSNLVGSIKNNLSDIFTFNYKYSIDNDLRTFEQNSLVTNFKLGNFSTELKFNEQNGKIGDSNTLQNSFSYRIGDNNFLTFDTRRNRKINFTEYYDLIYEYKNDCLVAGFKYKKTYYKDRDLIPTEDIIFSITIFPITTYEKRYDRGK